MMKQLMTYCVGIGLMGFATVWADQMLLPQDIARGEATISRAGKIIRAEPIWSDSDMLFKGLDAYYVPHMGAVAGWRGADGRQRVGTVDEISVPGFHTMLAAVRDAEGYNASGVGIVCGPSFFQDAGFNLEYDHERHLIRLLNSEKCSLKGEDFENLIAVLVRHEKSHAENRSAIVRHVTNVEQLENLKPTAVALYALKPLLGACHKRVCYNQKIERPFRTFGASVPRAFVGYLAYSVAQYAFDHSFWMREERRADRNAIKEIQTTMPHDKAVAVLDAAAREFEANADKDQKKYAKLAGMPWHPAFVEEKLSGLLGSTYYGRLLVDEHEHAKDRARLFRNAAEEIRTGKPVVAEQPFNPALSVE